MSLLMDALKQAERGRDEERNQDPLTPEVESKPLDNPPAAAAAPSQPLPQPAPAQTSESTQELSLQPAEPAAPRATGPETADSGTGIPVEASAAPVQAVVGDESGPAQEPAPTATARAEPAPEPEPASAPEPDPESGLQPESDVPQAEAVEPAATTSQSPVRAAQLLAAKRHRDRRSQRLWLISAALVLMVMAAGIALFGALPHPEDNSQMMLGLSESIAPVSEIDPDAQTSPQASASAAVPADVVPETATRAAVAAVVEGVYPDPEVTPAHPPEPAATSAPAAAPASQPAAADQTIRIRRSQRLPQLNSHLRQAYQAYQNGDYAGAQRIYDNILADRPQQRDARLGRAAVALQQGDRETARQHYAALLRLDPTDAAAHAALAGLQGQPSPELESQLRDLLETQPRSAHLHFALGNLYAEQQRWAEAQQAYFEAYRNATENPDYAYNLAVSLDRLDQSRSALEYYRKALTLNGAHSAQFDPQRLRARIATLSARQTEDPA